MNFCRVRIVAAILVGECYSPDHGGSDQKEAGRKWEATYIRALTASEQTGSSSGVPFVARAQMTGRHVDRCPLASSH